MEKASNKQDQYTKRNNLEIHVIPVDVKNEQLEQKVIDIFSHLNINISKPNIEDCHRIGKSNTIVRFVNRKVCKDALEKSLRSIDLLITQSLVLKGTANCLFVRIQLPTTSILPGCIGSKKKIHNSWSNKGIIKFRRTMNQ